MDIDVLKDRIAKKEVQIEKIDRRIKKWAAKCSKEAQDEIKELDSKYSSFVTWRKENNVSESGNEYELWSAYRDRNEAVTQLTKYKNSLEFENARAGEEKVKILMDFLTNWKNKVVEYVEDNLPDLKKYLEAANERNDLQYNWYKYNYTREEYKEKLKVLQDKVKELKSKVDPLTLSHYSYKKDDIDYDSLNKTLDKEIERKYYNMIERVTDAVGNITDASNLKIGRDGNINGIIVGDKGKAKLETIGAGGYNIQVYHFRLLVHRVK